MGQLTPVDQRHVLFHKTSCSTIKAEGGHFARAAIAQGLAGHRLTGGAQLQAFLHHLTTFFFFKPIKQSLSQLMRFLSFVLPILFPIPLERGERATVWR